MPAKSVTFIVPGGARPAQLREVTRSRLRELVRGGQARVAGDAVRRPGLRLRGGERIELTLVERPPLAAAPEAIPLRGLYEDDDLVAVDKPAGMTVHPGAGARSGTLVNALLHRYGRLSSAGGPLRPGIVHRLPPPPAPPPLPVARDLVRRTRMTTRRRQGRAALTEYRVLGSAGGFTLAEALLHTGRTHQIRVHFAALGHPVVGDTLYGAPRELRWGNVTRPTLNRIFLHAARLRFQHPRTGKVVEVRAELPASLGELLRALGLESPAPG